MFAGHMRVGGSLLAGLFAIGVMSSCSDQKSASPQGSAAAPKADLWGDMKPLVSVKELMRDMIDPASDLVFGSIGTIIIDRNIREIEPKTDDDWQRIRTGAVTMAEGVYLLKVKRPFAPPGDENNSAGAEAPELSPAQIAAKIEALRNVSREVLDIVDRKDKNELWEASDNLDQACESCHLQFWYPNELAFLDRIDKRLDELYGGASKARRRSMGMRPDQNN
jgi:hypothetical protein